MPFGRTVFDLWDDADDRCRPMFRRVFFGAGCGATSDTAGASRCNLLSCNSVFCRSVVTGFGTLSWSVVTTGGPDTFACIAAATNGRTFDDRRFFLIIFFTVVSTCSECARAFLSSVSRRVLEKNDCASPNKSGITVSTMFAAKNDRMKYVICWSTVLTFSSVSNVYLPGSTLFFLLRARKRALMVALSWMVQKNTTTRWNRV